MATPRKFRDVNVNFKAHPITGDIRVVTDDDAVKQAVKTLVLTSFYEKPFHPEIGSNVSALLFELNTTATVNEIRNSIIEVIKNYEPRAELTDVAVKSTPDQNSYEARIEFRVLNSQSPVNLTIFLERLR